MVGAQLPTRYTGYIAYHWLTFRRAYFWTLADL